MKNISRFRSIVLILIVGANSGCANLGDSTTSLGSGYTYRVDGSDRWINTDHVLKQKVYPNIIDYAYNKDFIIMTQEPSIKGYQRFLSQDLRDEYNFAIFNWKSTKPEGLAKRFLNSHVWTDSMIHKRVSKEIKPDNQADFNAIDSIADSILKYDVYFKKDFVRKKNYWIIQKNQSLVLGPFSKQEFLLMRNKLAIPKDLEIDN